MRRASFISLLPLTVALAACAPKRIALPADAGVPLRDFATIHQQLTAACSDVRTMTAELSLSGRAGDQALRGRVIAGFERPAAMRLEGVAPFGQPVFILVTSPGRGATLLLPRDARVVRGEEPQAVLGALTGVALAPQDLQAILTGCVHEGVPLGGRELSGGWASIQLAGGATMFLRRNGQGWRLRAARVGPWQIEYAMAAGPFPSSVALHADSPVRVDVTAALSQVEINVALDANAFTVTVPPDAQPLSLDVLRANGPLRAAP